MSDGSPTGGGASRGLAGALLFILSMSTLALEIVQVRVFSFSLNPVFVYMVISLALLGIGASGTALSLMPGLRKIPLPKALAACLLLFSITAVLANMAFARLSHHIVTEAGVTLASPVTLIFLLFAVPYFFSGMGVALVLLSDREAMTRNYFVNLAGNGVGCFIVYPFLPSLGAQGVVLLVLLPCAVAGALTCWRHARSWAPAATLAAVLFAVSPFFGAAILPFQPDRSDFYQLTIDKLEETTGEDIEPVRKFTRWDPVGKIEIHEFPEPHGLFAGDVPTLFLGQDAGAPSMLFNMGARPEVGEILGENSVYGLATSLRDDPDVLVMGIGGAPDVLGSLGAGAGHVTAVEINGAVVSAVEDVFRDFLGVPPEEAGLVTFVHSDGRAFARRYRDRFDVIQMTGADTYAAGQVSGSILSENYLYTLEAFEDYFDALKDDGILAVTRFGLEPIKIATTAATALRSRGVTSPSRNVVMVLQGKLWVLSLIKKTPFSPAEIAQIGKFITDAQGRSVDFSLPFFDTIGFTLKGPLTPLYWPEVQGEQGLPLLGQLLRAADQGTMDAVIAAQPEADYSPSTDDKPFFLQMTRLNWPSLGDLFGTSTIGDPLTWSVHRYFAILVQIGILALALILGPVFVLRRRTSALRLAAPLALYFFAIGTGFMLVEIGLMQRFTLFLGHPNYSISTVLFSVLLFSGIGSWTSGRWGLGLRATLTLATSAIAVGVLLIAVGSTAVFNAFLGDSVLTRIGISVLLLAPISFFMGMPLPNLLKLTEEHVPEFAPWALGVNGFASVLASLATIPMTVAVGFSATFAFGALAYVVALSAFYVIHRAMPART